MFNRPEFVESVLAINLLGAIAVPANFRMTAQEVAFISQDCDARAIINVAVFGQTEMSRITCVLEGRHAIRKLGPVGRVNSHGPDEGR